MTSHDVIMTVAQRLDELSEELSNPELLGLSEELAKVAVLSDPPTISASGAFAGHTSNLGPQLQWSGYAHDSRLLSDEILRAIERVIEREVHERMRRMQQMDLRYLRPPPPDYSAPKLPTTTTTD